MDLRKFPLFANLPEEELKIANGLLRVKEFARREIVCRKQEAAAFLRLRRRLDGALAALRAVAVRNRRSIASPNNPTATALNAVLSTSVPAPPTLLPQPQHRDLRALRALGTSTRADQS